MASLNTCLHISIDVTTNDTAVEGSLRLAGGTTPLEGRVVCVCVCVCACV